MTIVRPVAGGHHETLRATRTRVAEGCAWYLLLAVSTCVAKFAYLDQVYARNVGSAIAEIAAGRSPVFIGALLVARDVQQTFLLALLVGMLASPLAARGRATVYRVASLLYVAVLAANFISFVELGAFASVDLLATSWGWISKRPQMLLDHISWTLALSVGAAIVWTLLPNALARVAPRVLPWVVAVMLVTSIPLSSIATKAFGDHAFPLYGYWPNVIQKRGAETNPLSLAVPAEADLLARYQTLAALPAGPESYPRTPNMRPRHIVVVGLETAPQAFYPLTTSDALPTFKRMTEHAIVGERHYTTSPYTRIANFSMLSGLYAPPSGLPMRFGPIAADGVASVLRQHGYETSYVDSWILDWLPGSGERAQAEMLGFDTVIDSKVRRDDGVFEVLLEAEHVAFDTALDQITDASARGHKAMVFVGTMLGHAPWPAAQGDEALDGPARIHKLTLALDGLFAGLLDGLAKRGLDEEVIILVVGDHGFRLTEEFRSVGKTYTHSDLAFNVPFLLYAPGLIDRTVRIAYPTSHVDITPTLLHLVGVSTDGMLHHGSDVRDPRLAERVVFLSNSKLGPIDGYVCGDNYVTYHALSGGISPPSVTLPPMLRDPVTLLGAFDTHTTLVAAALLQRGARLAAEQRAQPGEHLRPTGLHPVESGAAHR